MPWRVSAGTMASTAHSFFPHILGLDPQNPGVQLLASSQRSKGCPPRMGSSQPPWLSAPASGQEGSSGLAPGSRRFGTGFRETSKVDVGDARTVAMAWVNGWVEGQWRASDATFEYPRETFGYRQGAPRVCRRRARVVTRRTRGGSP